MLQGFLGAGVSALAADVTRGGEIAGDVLAQIRFVIDDRNGGDFFHGFAARFAPRSTRIETVVPLPGLLPMTHSPPISARRWRMFLNPLPLLPPCPLPWAEEALAIA